MSSLSLLKGLFDWGWGNRFGWRRRCRDWETIAPKYVKKSLISRQTQGYLRTLDLTQIFEKTFYLFAHSTTAFPSFLG